MAIVWLKSDHINPIAPGVGEVLCRGYDIGLQIGGEVGEGETVGGAAQGGKVADRKEYDKNMATGGGRSMV